MCCDHALRRLFAVPFSPSRDKQSDHLAICYAYETWTSVPRHAEWDFCRKNFLSQVCPVTLRSDHELWLLSAPSCCGGRTE